jgi:hypothetical protein
VNNDLYSTTKGVIEFPKDKRQHMKICFQRVNGADENTEGYNRNLELQKQQTIDYKQLKRIKNFFDNFKGNQNDMSFILNGGIEMKNWVDNELRRMREFGKMTKNNKMETGMQNAFLSPHEKKDFTNVRTSQEHSKTVGKYNASVTESLRRINEIISKI